MKCKDYEGQEGQESQEPREIAMLEGFWTLTQWILRGSGPEAWHTGTLEFDKLWHS